MSDGDVAVEARAAERGPRPLETFPVLGFGKGDAHVIPPILAP